MATAEFFLTIENHYLKVEAGIPFRKNDGLPRITLNKNAIVTHMALNRHDHFQRTVSPDNNYFTTYSLEEAEDGVLQITYTTPVAGWDNLISKDVIAISLYSHAFPANLSEYITDSICFFSGGFEAYEIYDAYFDSARGMYAKRTKKLFGEIANIIGFPKGRVRIYQKDKIRVIYRDDCNCQSVFWSIDIGLQAFRYYGGIFPRREISEIDVVVLGNKEPGSAYNREHLIVLGEPMTSLPSEELQNMMIYQMFPHELAHIWFGKADSCTFEDWLNETGAEWSHLLFLLESGQNALFDSWIRLHYDNHRQRGEAIRPRDLHHPDTVHDSGVVLFHKIYEIYGKGAVLKLLQILSRMEQQNTESFLQHIESAYDREIAAFIQRNLDEKIP